MLGLTDAQQLKFGLLDEGLTITAKARDVLDDLLDGRGLSPHDYASTSGVILELDDEVWVNAPIEQYNPNFVGQSSFVLDHSSDQFEVNGAGFSSAATVWPQPTYHGSRNAHGPLNNYVVTHGDRGRLSPLRSCSMTCTFCNIPYDDPISVYALKSVDALIDAARTAVDDPLQPARHLLISGGTPKPKDVPWMREFYAAVLRAFPDIAVDIMMVPLTGLFDLPTLKGLGLNELSINIELFNREQAKTMARNKHNQGLDFYLDFIEAASDELGPGRARSMLMVGLEPLDDTLEGVEAIARRGGTPVLSPFRPDPATPERLRRPPTAEQMVEAYARASEIVARHGMILGPDCPPCSHNTLSFAHGGDGSIRYPHARPAMVGSAR